MTSSPWVEVLFVGQPETRGEIDAIRVEKRHAFLAQQSGHDVRVAPMRAAAQEPVAIDDPGDTEARPCQVRGSAPSRLSVPSGVCQGRAR